MPSRIKKAIDYFTGKAAPPKKDSEAQEFAGMVKRRLDEGLQSRAARERSWFLSLAMLEGDHWSEFNDQLRTFRAPSDFPWRQRPIRNRVRAFVEQAVAKMTKNRPDFFTVPASSEASDEAAAKVSEDLLEFQWYRLAISKLVSQAAVWEQTVGNVFLHQFWDPDVGEPVVDDEKGAVLEGEIGMEVVSPFEIIPDPLAIDLAGCQWLIRCRVVYKDWILAHYPHVDADRLGLDVAADRFYSSTTKNILGANGRANPIPSGTGEQLATFTEYWERPSKKHPQGRYGAISNDQVLKEPGDLPYDHLKIPFSEWADPLSVGNFWRTSRVEQAAPIQKEYNKISGAILENLNLTSRPQRLAEEGSYTAGTINNTPGLIIDYKRGRPKPEWSVPPPMPMYVLEALRQCIADIQEVFGQHEVSRGQVPSGIRSGRAVAFLQEQDDSRLGPHIYAMEKCIEDSGSQLLALMRQFYKESRTIRIVGKNNEILVRQISGNDISSDVSVRVQAGSAFPRSKAAKAQDVYDLLDRKVFDPANDKDRAAIWRLLDLERTDSTVEEARLDERMADYENTLMADGKVVMVREFQDPVIHLARHEVHQKSLEFLEYPDNIQAIFDAHKQMHAEQLRALASGGQPSAEPGPMAAPADNLTGSPVSGGMPPPAGGQTGEVAQPMPGAPPEAETRGAVMAELGQ